MSVSFNEIDDSTPKNLMPKITNLIKKCHMTGGIPWGFRIMTDLRSKILTPGILSNLVVSKVIIFEKKYSFRKLIFLTLYGGTQGVILLFWITDFYIRKKMR